VTADGHRFPAHRAILAACSNYFKAIFTQPFKEQAQQELLLDRIQPHILREILEFAYVRNATVTEVRDFSNCPLLSLIIRQENLDELLEWANYFAIDKLIRQCCLFAIKRINVSNCLGLLSMTRHYHFTDFHDDVWAFVQRRFEEVSRRVFLCALTAGSDAGRSNKFRVPATSSQGLAQNTDKRPPECIQRSSALASDQALAGERPRAARGPRSSAAQGGAARAVHAAGSAARWRPARPGLTPT